MLVARLTYRYCPPSPLVTFHQVLQVHTLKVAVGAEAAMIFRCIYVH